MYIDSSFYLSESPWERIGGIMASVLASSVVDCEPLWWKNTPIECGRLLVQSIQIKSRLKFPFSPRNT